MPACGLLSISALVCFGWVSRATHQSNEKTEMESQTNRRRGARLVKCLELWGQNVRNLCLWHVGRYIRNGKPTWLLPKISFWLAAAFCHPENFSSCPSFQIFNNFDQGKTFYNTFVELDVWMLSVAKTKLYGASNERDGEFVRLNVCQHMFKPTSIHTMFSQCVNLNFFWFR